MTDISSVKPPNFVVGFNIVFQVIDNGEGSKAPPDLISLTPFLGIGPPRGAPGLVSLRPSRLSTETSRCIRLGQYPVCCCLRDAMSRASPSKQKNEARLFCARLFVVLLCSPFCGLFVAFLWCFCGCRLLTIRLK